MGVGVQKVSVCFSSNTSSRPVVVGCMGNGLRPSPDLDGDGAVDFSDFMEFAAHFGKTEGQEGYHIKCDFDLDGKIGFGDFLDCFVPAMGGQ